MQDLSALYESIVAGPYSCRVKMSVYDDNNTLVGEFGMNKLKSISTEQGMIRDDKLLVGNCIGGSIHVSFYPTDENGNDVEIPRMAKLIPWVQVFNTTNESEWVQKGEFFVDTRATSAISNLLEITGYDAMLKTEADYPTTGAEYYPKTDIEMVELIAATIGVTVDERTYDVINADYQLNLPMGYSCREVLSGIATLYGANFVITDLGELRAIGVGNIGRKNRLLGDEYRNVLLIGGVGIIV